MERNDIKYSIVTAARNEANNITSTLESVVNQTILPAKWVIVNDGSTDGTGEILSSYAEKYEWIEIVHFEDKGFKDYESAHGKLKVGLDKILTYRNDFIVKMDADMTFDNNYFEEIFKRFAHDPKLGIAGGWFYVREGSKTYPEDHPEFHVRGGSKVYRSECWEDIGGFVFKLGYDTIDEIKANMRGWRTKSFKDIMVIHKRKTGDSHGTVKEPAYRGKICYLVGYHPLFMALKSIKRMFRRPYLIGGVAQLMSFLACYLTKRERSINEKEFIKYLRKQQINKIFFRKTIWH